MSEKREHKCIPVKTFLKDGSSTLAPLCERAAYLQQMNLDFCSQLPVPLKDHCKLANIANDAVLLHAESSAWAARLRYYTPDLLNIVQNRLKLSWIRTIRIKIMFPEEKEHSNLGRKSTMSASTSRHIADTASCTSDPELKATLLRLSRHAD